MLLHKGNLTASLRSCFPLARSLNELQCFHFLEEHFIKNFFYQTSSLNVVENLSQVLTTNNIIRKKIEQY